LVDIVFIIIIMHWRCLCCHAVSGWAYFCHVCVSCRNS